MMEERGVRGRSFHPQSWVVKYAPLPERQFRVRKRAVGGIWRLDETYVKVKGCWKYLYRADYKAGATVDFLLTTKLDRKAALRFLRICSRATTKPNSARWPRTALMICVRWRTSISGVRNTTAALCAASFDRYEAHCRALDGFADRFRVGGIVLLTRYKRLDVGRRNQPYAMAELTDLSSPEMRPSASLHGHDARRLSSKEFQHLRRRSFLRKMTAPDASAP
jgi:hypothetical protein